MVNLDKNIKKARELYLERGILKREVMRDEIVYSWVRSRLINLDFKSEPKACIPLENNIDIARILNTLDLNTFGLELSMQNLSAIHILDNNGEILNSWSKSPLERFYFNFSEESLGTSGISLSIKSHKKAYAIGPEHYHDFLQENVTIGIPISNNLYIGFILKETYELTAIESLMARLPERFNYAPEVVGLVEKVQGNALYDSIIDSDFESDSVEVAMPSCIVGDSPFATNARKRVEKLQNSPLVFILGPSGTGKETLANYLHQLRTQNSSLFHTVYCDRIPLNRIEADWIVNSEKTLNNLSVYNIGTVYFEHFNGLPHAFQHKLLRFMDSKLVYSDGDSRCNNSDLAFIISINNDEKYEKSQTGLTQSLQHRVKLTEINLPNMEKRKEDKCPILRHMISTYIRDTSVIKDLMDKLMDYNITDIRFERNLRDLDYIARDVSEQYTKYDSVEMINFDDILDTVIPNTTSIEGLMSLSQVEASAILNTLKTHNYNMVQSAKTLGISRSTLYRKIEQYGIQTEGVL